MAPWANIIIKEPLAPTELFILNAAISNPMCPTEEYAIIIFKSLSRKHNNLTKIAPISEIDIQTLAKWGKALI